MVHADEGEQFGGACAVRVGVLEALNVPVGARDTGEHQLLGGEVVEPLLRVDVTDALLQLLDSGAAEFLAEDLHRAGRRVEASAGHLEHGGLAGTVGAEDRPVRPGRDGDAVVLDEGFRSAADRDVVDDDGVRLIHAGQVTPRAISHLTDESSQCVKC